MFSAESVERRDLLSTDGLATDGQTVGRLVTDRLDVDQLVISEVHFDPTGGNSEQDEYFEIRGVPRTTVPSGTYFVVVEGGTGGSTHPGTIHSVFDLGGLTLGGNGYLAILQGGAGYRVDPQATIVQGTSGFAGLPSGRFSDNSPFSNRFAYLFDSASFLLIQSAQAPVAHSDVDQDDDGRIDTAERWSVLDSVSVLGTRAGGRSTDLAYGDIVFRAGGNDASQPGKTIVDLADVHYVARLASTGSDASDWMAGETRELHKDQFDFEVSARTGNEAYRKFVGRQLNHIGGSNFFATVSGTYYHDANANGTRDTAEAGLAGEQVFLDENLDGILNSLETIADADSFLEGDILTQAFPGVTLTAADTHNNMLSAEITAEAVSGTSTGTLAFSQAAPRLMMDFVNPVNSVSIDFGVGPTPRRGVMEAYDADGSLLDTYFTSASEGTNETMTVSSSAVDIAMVVAYADSPIAPFGPLDNLRFTQPERSATTGGNGNYEFNYVVPRPGALIDLRAAAQVVTAPVEGKHSITLPFAADVTGLDLGVESRQAYDIVGRTSDGTWWGALSDGRRFNNQWQMSWPTDVAWADILEGRFRGQGSEIVGRNGHELWVVEFHDTSFVHRHWGDLPYSDGWVDVMDGDLNGDGQSDWVGRHEGEWWVGESTTDDRFSIRRWNNWSNTVQWHDVRLGDFNGDGRDDIAGRTNGEWWIALASETPSNTTFQNQYWGDWSRQYPWDDVTVGDFNGDGLDDIAGRADSRWWVARSTGTSFETEYWGEWSRGATWEDVVVADFTGDGMDDIAGRADGQWWVSQSAANHFSTTPWGTWPHADEWRDVVSADFTGDGLDDIAGWVNGSWWVASSDGQQFAAEPWTQWSTDGPWLDIQVGQFGSGFAARNGSVSNSTGALAGDLNQNGTVGFDDFLILSGSFGADVPPGSRADLDGDGHVGFEDFLLLSADFGRTT